MQDGDDNVVDFTSRRSRPPADRCFPRNDETPAERSARARVIRENVENKVQFGSGENIFAAKALYRLLEELKAYSGKSFGTLLHAAGIDSDEKTASRHLSQYAIPEKGSAHLLRKKPGAYAKIAESAAGSVAHPKFLPDEALLWVFGATSLAQGQSRKKDAEDAGDYAELSRRINRVADEVASRYKLQAFFRDVHRARVGFVCLGGENRVFDHNDMFKPFRVTFQRPQSNGAGTLHGWGLQPQFHILPSFPMLPLACVVLHERKLPQMWISDDGKHHPYAEVKLEMRACISLCIVPVGEDFQPRAALQVTLWPALLPTYFDNYWPGEEFAATFHDDHALVEDEDTKTDYVPYGEALMPAKLPQLIRKLFCSGDAKLSFDKLENTRFLPIDAGPCRDVLGLSIDHSREPLEHYLLPDEPICEPGSGSQLGVPFPSGSIAGCLDRLLWASEPDLRDRLNALAANLTETFVRARDEEMKNRDRVLAAFDARPEVEG